MDCQRDLPAIKLTAIIAFAAMFFASANSVAADDDRMMRNRHLAISEEQLYWKRWIARNGGGQCPLQPFVVGHSQSVISQADSLIQGLGNHENAVLFVRVNIDNGILYIAYLAWNDASDRIDFVEIKGLTDHPSLTTRTKGELSVPPQLANLAGKDGLIDIPNPRILDADSLYLSVRHGESVSRFAAYGAKINAGKSGNTFAQYAEYLLSRVGEPKS